MCITSSHFAAHYFYIFTYSVDGHSLIRGQLDSRGGPLTLVEGQRMEEAEYDLPEQRLLDFEPVVDITKRVCERYGIPQLWCWREQILQSRVCEDRDLQGSGPGFERPSD